MGMASTCCPYCCSMCRSSWYPYPLDAYMWLGDDKHLAFVSHESPSSKVVTASTHAAYPGLAGLILER